MSSEVGAQEAAIKIGGNGKISGPDKGYPAGWTQDALSDYLEAAHQQRFATFEHKRPWFRRLSELDTCFLTIVEGWVNPQDPIAVSFFCRAHAAFRASCEHALAGQGAEVYPQIRSMLEYAAYALRLHSEPALLNIWLNGHASSVNIKRIRQEFSHANLRETIGKRNRKAADVFDMLYDRCIDLGGHPNDQALFSNMRLSKDVTRTQFLNIYLHSDGLQLEMGLKTAAQAGVCALEIFQEIFSARFELLGVRADLLRLRKGV